MKPSLKLNVLLAVTDTLRVKFKNMVADHIKFYTHSQGAFLGLRNTYEAKQGMIDDPSKKKFVKVITTVDEKIDYYIKESAEFISGIFAQEKTNASGVANAELIVEGESWGVFSSLELLRLKSLLEGGEFGNFENLLSSIPVRSDAEIWNKTNDEEYTGRAIWETPLQSGVTRTSVKEEYILEDPNIGKISGGSYTPKVSSKTLSMDVGDYTTQNFSGQWSQRERAYALKRRNDLIVAVTAALKEANDCQVIESTLTANKIFGYIFKGNK